MTEQCTSVDIINDNVVETDERFLVQLATNDESVDLDPSAAEVIISDDDGELYSQKACPQLLWPAIYIRMVLSLSSLIPPHTHMHVRACTHTHTHTCTNTTFLCRLFFH